MSEACNPIVFLEPIASSTTNLLDNPSIVAANDGARITYGIQRCPVCWVESYGDGFDKYVPRTEFRDGYRLKYSSSGVCSEQAEVLHCAGR
jgi:hypothetical protein